MIWDEWKNTKAADRIKLHDEIADAFNGEELKALQINTPQHFALLRELAFGSSHHCDCCEESKPDVMLYEGIEMDDDAAEGIEGDIVSEYEYHVCAWCVREKREEVMCEHCKSHQWGLHTWVLDGDTPRRMPKACLPSKGYKHKMVHVHPYPQEASE